MDEIIGMIIFYVLVVCAIYAMIKVFAYWTILILLLVGILSIFTLFKMSPRF